MPTEDAPPLRLRYGGDADFAPFESLDDQGRPRGFQIELLALLTPLTGLQFEVQLAPWARTEQRFRDGQLDVVAMVVTAARQRWARFTHGHATPALALYRRADQPEPQGLADLSALRLAVLDHEAMRATLATALADRSGPLQRHADAASALQAVASGQADLALLPRAYADALLRQPQHAALRASSLSLDLQTYALAVAPARADLQQRLQHGLDQLEHSGQLQALRKRWLSSHRELAQLDRMGDDLQQRQWQLVGLAGGATASLALMAWGLRRRGLRIAAERRAREQADAARQQAEAALQQAQELLNRTFVDHADAMLVLGGDERLLDANAAALQLLERPAEALLGQPLTVLRPLLGDAGLAALRQGIAQAVQADADATPQPPPEDSPSGLLPLRRPDGQRRHALMQVQPLQVDGQRRALCMLHDITERLQADAGWRRALQQSQQQLAQQTEAREQAQAAQARAEDAKVRAEDAKARAEDLLQGYTRHVAHDLKTPILAVQGFNGLLQQRLRAGQVQEALGFSEHIDRAAQRMAGMVAALSRLARIGQQPLQRVPVNMQQLVDDTRALLLAARPGLDTQWRLGSLPAVAADRDLCAQLWQNLLDNAVKYSARSQPPRVAVDSHQDERGVWFRITDNGVGFDMAKAERLCQPFQRLHSAQQFEGSGIGLSVVRRIVDHHGGALRLRSAPGVGTVAEFTLDPEPAAESAPGPAPVPAASPPTAD